MNASQTPPLALYVDWPFCVSKCPYCDFNSHVRAEVDQAAWREALLADLAYEARETAGQRLGVEVKPDAATYPVCGHAKVRIKVTQPDGKPVAAGTEVAVAAVDEALLELAPNTSWNLLDAMWQRRSYSVTTATAQMEIIGRRHYGRKAVPAGGGGGKSPTRELFDTLLLWQPRVVLDDKGEAIVVVDLEGKSNIANFTVIASGRSTRQVSAMADHIVERIQPMLDYRIAVEGAAQGDWVLLDCGDVIVHLFRPEVRAFYAIEKMWGLEPPAATGSEDPLAL